MLETNLYEAMFLVDSAKGGSDFPEVIRHIADLLERHDAEIERIEKWDERELAYPIKGAERGIYILTYFNQPPEQVNQMRKAINLSEDILRAQVLKEPKVSEPQGELFNSNGEVIQKPEETAAEEEEAEEKPEAEAEAAEEAEEAEKEAEAADTEEEAEETVEAEESE